MRAVIRLVAADRVDPSGLTAAERAQCLELGSPALRMAARVAAKQAAASLLGPAAGTAGVGRALTVERAVTGAPTLGCTATLDSPLPGVTMSHGGGWGAALAWLG